MELGAYFTQLLYALAEPGAYPGDTDSSGCMDSVERGYLLSDMFTIGGARYDLDDDGEVTMADDGALAEDLYYNCP